MEGGPPVGGKGITMYPASPNWFCSSVMAWEQDNLAVYASRNALVLFSPSERRFTGTLVGHTDRVTSVAMDKHGRIVSGSADGSVRAWDSATRSCTHVLRAHPKGVAAVSISPTSGRVVSADRQGALCTWNFADHVMTKSISTSVSAVRLHVPARSRVSKSARVWVPRPRGDITALAVSTGSLTAIGYRSGALLIVDPLSQRIVAQLDGHDDAVQQMRWRPWADKTLGTGTDQIAEDLTPPVLASSSRDGTVRFWTRGASNDRWSQARAPVRPPRSARGGSDSKSSGRGGRQRTYTSIAWASHDRILVSGDGGAIRSISYGKKSSGSAAGRAARTACDHTHNRVVFGLCVHGNCLLSCGMDRIVALRPLTPKTRSKDRLPVATLGAFVYALVAPAGSPHLIAMGLGDGTVKFWNTARAANPLHTTCIWRGLQSRVISLAWHPSVAGLLAYGTDDGRVGILSSSEPRHLTRLPVAHKGGVWGLRWGPLPGAPSTVEAEDAVEDDKNGGGAASGSIASGSTASGSTASGNVNGESDVISGGMALYSCGADHRVISMRIDAKRLRGQVKQGKSAARRADKRGASTPATSSGVSRGVDMFRVQGAPPSATDVAIHPTGRLAATGHLDGTVSIFAAVQGKWMLVRRFADQTKSINRVRWQAETRAEGAPTTWRLASASDSGTVAVFCCADLAHAKRSENNQQAGPLSSSRTAASGQTAADVGSVPEPAPLPPLRACSARYRVLNQSALREPPSIGAAWVLVGHRAPCKDVAWDPDPTRDRLASAAYDGSVQIWNLSARGAEAKLNVRLADGKLLCVFWSAGDVRRVYCGGFDQSVRSFDPDAMEQANQDGKITHTVPPHAAAFLTRAKRANKTALVVPVERAAATSRASGGSSSGGGGKKTKGGHLLDSAVAAALARKRAELSDKAGGLKKSHTVDAKCAPAATSALKRGGKKREGPLLSSVVIMGNDGVSSQEITKISSDKTKTSSQELLTLLNPGARDAQAQSLRARFQAAAAKRAGGVGPPLSALTSEPLGRVGLLTELEMRVRNGTLNDLWVSLSAALGLDIWRGVSAAHARQLISEKRPHEASMRYLSISEPRLAVDALMAASMYADAAGLAASALEGDGDALRSVYVAWARACEARGEACDAAKLHLLAGAPQSAINALLRKPAKVKDTHGTGLARLRLALGISTGLKDRSEGLRRQWADTARRVRDAEVAAWFDDLVTGIETKHSLECRRRVWCLPARRRGPDGRVVAMDLRWNPARTAVIICDVWDQHWCASATRRVSELAPRLNAFVERCREQGATVVHCPSGVTGFYESLPARNAARKAPWVRTPVPLSTRTRWGYPWCWPDPRSEPALPIDDSDDGCTCVAECGASRPCTPGEPWRRQHAAIVVSSEDILSDDGQEVWNALKQRGVENVMLCGVHLNMCVLGRPFAARQQLLLGMRVAIVRDLTDTMYNPQSPPKVSHTRGTELVVEHVERHLCPTLESTAILTEETTPFRFKPPLAKKGELVKGDQDTQQKSNGV